MSTQAKLIAINLKHFYQRRGCWFYYLFFLFVIAFPILNIAGISFRGNIRLSNDPQEMLVRILFLCFLMNMFAGMLTGDLVRSVAVRPFSVCLPGHRQIPTKIIVIMGLLVNISFAGLLAAGAQHFFSSIVLVFSLGMFIYVSFAITVLKSLKPRAGVSFFGFFGLYGFMWALFEMNSLWISAVLFAVCWWWLRKLDTVRIAEKLCDVPTLDMFSIWNTEEAKRVDKYRIAKRNDRLGFGIVALLEKLMRSTSARSVKYGLGLAVTGCGFRVVNIWSILGLLFVVLIFCYMPVEVILVKIMLFIMPVFSVIGLSNAGRIPMLVGCGRKERAVGSIIAGLIYTVLIAVQLVLMVLLTVLSDKIMPDISFAFMNGFVLDFEPLKFRYIIVVFFTMPIVYAFSLISARLGFAASFFVIYGVMGVIVAENALRAEYGYVLASYPALLILPLILLCGVSYLTIRRHFLTADLKFAR